MEEDSGASPLSFTDFLEKMKDPAAANLVRTVKSFIKEFEERHIDGHAQPDEDAASVQGLEKYLMSKVWRLTFAACAEDRERDERCARILDALSFVTLDVLMGTHGVEPDASLVVVAVGELLKMDKYKAPRDKLVCLVNVKTTAESIVQAAVANGARIGGADAFFPVLLLVAVRARPQKLASTIEYIKRFRGASRLRGQFDYMLANLESVALYLDTVNYEHLHISREEFLAKLSAAGLPEAALELERRENGPASPVAAGQDPLPASPPSSGAGPGAEDVSAPTESREGSTPQSHLLDADAASAPPTHEKDYTQSLDPELSELLSPGSAAEDTTTPASKQEARSSPVPCPASAQEAHPGNAADDRHLFGGAPLCSALEGEPSFLADMVADGVPALLRAEAAGELQPRYPFLYAAAADLSLADVASVLAGYKQLVLQYEALTYAVRAQLTGQDHGSPSQAREGGGGEQGEVDLLMHSADQGDDRDRGVAPVSLVDLDGWGSTGSASATTAPTYKEESSTQAPIDVAAILHRVVGSEEDQPCTGVVSPGATADTDETHPQKRGAGLQPSQDLLL